MSSNLLEIGTLNDKQIADLCKESILIEKDFAPSQIHQACYELRSGTVYYDLTDGHKRLTVRKDEDILIKPSSYGSHNIFRGSSSYRRIF